MGRTYESMMEELEVIEILSTAYDGDEFPGYENIRLSFSQLEMYALSDFLIMVYVMVSEAVT